jgi:hypothetical protein
MRKQSGRLLIYRKCVDRYEALYIHIDARLHVFFIYRFSNKGIAEESKRLSQKATMARNRAYDLMGEAKIIYTPTSTVRG